MAKTTISVKKASLFWNKFNGDSVAEEEDEDIFLSFQSSSKRTKFMTTPVITNKNPMSDGTNFERSLSRPQNIRNIPIRIEKKTFRQRVMSQEVKENDPDVIEVIDLDSKNEQKPVERRPLLTNTATRIKPRNFNADLTARKTHSPHLHRSNQEKKQLEMCVGLSNSSKKLEINVSVPEKKQNGVHSSIYNGFASSQLRPSRTSTPKVTALDQTHLYADRMTYSKLLQQYNNYSSHKSEFQDCPSTSIKKSVLQNGLSSFYGPSKSKLADAGGDVVDLTRDDNGDHVKRRSQSKHHIPVKPYKSLTDDDDVKIIEERKLPCVNSLERKLSQNCLVSPEWITQLQERYSEKERETQRQIKEQEIKKELFSKHNEAKFFEVLNDRVRRHIKITDYVLDDTEPEEAALPELTQEMQDRISDALRPNPAGQGLVEGFGQKITRRDIQTLNGLNWLNDEVINFYMNLIIERGKGDKHISVYAFNTFFYPKLVSQGYSTLKRWTKKVDIFNHDLLLVPIHLGMHWCMASIDFRDKTVRYFDSMGGENNKCLHALLKYLNDESVDKKKSPYDTSDWKLQNMKDSFSANTGRILIEEENIEKETDATSQGNSRMQSRILQLSPAGANLTNYRVQWVPLYTVLFSPTVYYPPIG
ncbi:sentrin-specific protease 1-like isoform X2 [Macrosteles quadrilineatus]|uniref:sentrin-specific protease 1-like isoform X2 n=1 Tax=Macrosteles quadrilineatus TaxID=74068 RepID=UPI0023E13E07|nr:sentrin-specific protease 1-like isoform X2 [Macrosteles quadrilineatus]